MPEAYQLPNALGMRKSQLKVAHSGYKSYADKYINRIRKGSHDIDVKSRMGTSISQTNFNPRKRLFKSDDPLNGQDKARYGGISDIQSYIKDLNSKLNFKSTAGLTKTNSMAKFNYTNSYKPGVYNTTFA